MKKLYFLLLATLITLASSAQDIDFPDANFKSMLLQSSPDSAIATDASGHFIAIDANADGEISLEEAWLVHGLDVSVTGSENLIADFSGLLSFQNLRKLNISGHYLGQPVQFLSELAFLEELNCVLNMIPSLDVSDWPSLKRLNCSSNNMSLLDVSGCATLENLDASINNLTEIELADLPLLTSLSLYNNWQLQHLDISQLLALNSLSIGGMTNLISLNIKNGKNDAVVLDSWSNPALEYVCADNFEVQALHQMMIGTNCAINSYCSFVQGGVAYNVEGIVKFDVDMDGCETSDPSFPNLRFEVSDGSSVQTIYGNSTGSFLLPLSSGTYTVTPMLATNGVTISPSSLTLQFPDQTEELTHDFCIVPQGQYMDIDVQLIPTGPARPGFDSSYRIIYRNHGTLPASGNVTFSFPEDVADLVSSYPAATTIQSGLLTWAYTNLLPFETRYIDITLNLNSPMETPALTGGEFLSFGTTLSPHETGMETDNHQYIKQEVVNSFDPNDKTCLEGTVVGPDFIGEYVHYLIRFENTGTFFAQNIVVKDLIDTSKFDISTLRPMASSHDFVTRIEGDKVEFIFENIMLPFDDANNDGWISFKIKTLPTLSVGDSFSNTAEIYFDYNFPIITEPAVTTIEELSVRESENPGKFVLYPNPASSVVSLRSDVASDIRSVEVYNAIGQIVLVKMNSDELNVSELASGIYSVKVKSDKGISTLRFVKK